MIRSLIGFIVITVLVIGIVFYFAAKTNRPDTGENQENTSEELAVISEDTAEYSEPEDWDTFIGEDGTVTGIDQDGSYVTEEDNSQEQTSTEGEETEENTSQQEVVSDDSTQQDSSVDENGESVAQTQQVEQTDNGTEATEQSVPETPKESPRTGAGSIAVMIAALFAAIASGLVFKKQAN